VKILQVIPYFVPAWYYGGPVSAAYNLSKELSKRGHSITVYTTDTLNSEDRIKENEETKDGIKIRRFKNWSNSIASKHKIFFSPSMISGIRNNLKEFDVVHMFEYRTIQNIIVHHYAKKYRIPYILQAHGSLPRIMDKQKFKQIFDRLWGHRFLKDASKVIALTSAEVEQYKRMGVSDEKIEIIPNGIDLSEFENLPKRGEFRKKYGLNSSQKIILYLARIHKIKGPDLLARAFAGLIKELATAKLVIVGPDDGYLPSLKELIKELGIEEKVLFTGPLYGREKLEAYVDADVYILPSVYETFPISVLEAFACGTPVIVSNQCGIADVISSQAGYSVEYDKNQLHNAVVAILTKVELADRFRKKGYKLVREKFTLSRIIEQLEHLYLNVTV